TAAGPAGLSPIKRTVAVMRGIKDDEIADFARLTLEHEWHVRFIELMPVGEMREFTVERVVPGDEILQRLQTIASIKPAVGPSRGHCPDRHLRLEGAPGTIGLVNPMMP